MITEKGVIATQAVLSAGGAWTSMFCRRHGVEFPQASVRQTAVRTKPTVNLGEAIYTPDCSLTRRRDGSYTFAISGRATLDITPQGLRYARWFMPMFMMRLKAVQIGVSKSMFQGPEALANWSNDSQSPFERIRVLDPTPSRRTIAAILKGVTEQFPALSGVEIADSWGAYVDCTPDAVPVISEAGQVRGLYIAAGGSGHGFGIGPGIGRLAADLVANDTPCVDPAPFRLSRFFDGTKNKVGGL